MTPQDLELFTINTGRFYSGHLQLAAANAPLSLWLKHVKYTALPAYRHECKEPFEGLTLDELEETAKALQAYYTQHVKEL